MPHHCIVPLCTNNSATSKFSFYRLPVKKPDLLKKWLVAIRRENTPIHAESRVCSAHFENQVKKGSDDVPCIFAWTKPKRLPPKERIPLAPKQTNMPQVDCSESDTRLSYVNKTYEDAIVNTDLIEHEDAAVNTDILTYEDAITNTETSSLVKKLQIHFSQP